MSDYAHQKDIAFSQTKSIPRNPLKEKNIISIKPKLFIKSQPKSTELIDSHQRDKENNREIPLSFHKKSQ